MCSMIKYISLSLTALFLFVCRAESQESIKEIAAEAGIPLIQVAYSNGRKVVLYEDSAVFQAASLSKPVFAYIVMKMAHRGEIDLDAPLANYTDVLRFENRDYASKLTARVVLSHKSGLPNWAVSPSSSEWPDSKIAFKFRPDSAFSYSGEAFAFLQRAVENIKGKGLEEIATEEVFKPLGMASTSYLWLEKYDTLAAAGFTREGVNRGPGSFPRANSAYTLRTTAADYMKFLIALNDGRGIGKRLRNEMFSPVVNAVRYPERPRECDKTIFWGLGIGIEKHVELGSVAFHWGDNGNFKAFFLIVPKSKEHQQRILVYFTNSAAGHDIINKITTHILGNKEGLAIHDWVLK